MILKTMLCVVLVAAPAGAEVVRIEVKSRADVLAGQAFGAAGPYEKLSGTIYFAVDPRNTANQIIADIDKAPKNAAGKVEFSSDFYLIKPKDPAPRQRHGALRSVQSRRQGHDRVLQSAPPAASIRRRRSSSATGSCSSRASRCCGSAGSSIRRCATGSSACSRRSRERRTAVRFRAWCAATSFAIETDDAGLARRSRSPRLCRREPRRPGERPHRPRLGRKAPRRTIPRDQWQFTRGRQGRPHGRGLRAEEDLRSGLQVAGSAGRRRRAGRGARHDLEDEVRRGERARPCAGRNQARHRVRHFPERALSPHAISTTGSTRTKSHRKVFDGVMAHVAGSGRGSFNHRFAQPSRDGHPYINFFYPTDIFPFTDVAQRDPETGVHGRPADARRRSRSSSRTSSTRTRRTNTGAARRRSSTRRSTASKDAPLPANVRAYLLAAGQHGVAGFPPSRTHRPADEQPARLPLGDAQAARLDEPLGHGRRRAAAERLPAPRPGHARARRTS